MTIEGRTPDQQAIIDRQNACDHKWVAVYYGTKCPECELFYPHSCAPWDDVDEDQEEYEDDQNDESSTFTCF